MEARIRIQAITRFEDEVSTPKLVRLLRPSLACLRPVVSRWARVKVFWGMAESVVGFRGKSVGRVLAEEE
jgi:hypothetical protein